MAISNERNRWGQSYMQLDENRVEDKQSCSCVKDRRVRPFMDTSVSLTTLGLGPVCAGRAFAATFGCLDTLEASVNTQAPDSDLLRLWDAPVGKSVKVSECLWQLLCLARELSRRTGGLFDAVATGSGGSALWSDIDLPGPGFIRLRRRLRVDFGGIIKGYAVDLAVRVLGEMGVRRGIVEVGGVMRGFGPQEWRVHYHLDDDTQPLPVPLVNGALAHGGCSTTGLYDPRTGIMHSGQEWPGLRLLVRAGSAVLADGLSKVAMLAPAQAYSLLPHLGAHAVVMTRDGVQAFEYAS